MKTAALAVILAVLPVMIAGAQSVSIQLQDGSFRVTGWSAPASPSSGNWSSVFAVYTAAGDTPPLLGTYAVDHGTLTFHPKYPFAAGLRYRAVFRPPSGGSPIEKTFDGPPRAANPVARVENVYPTADILPANLLRVYIQFSAPMSRGEAGGRIHLLDAKGAVLPAVFLSGEELWDPAGTRLTMTLDPGRIKRGLTSNMALGAPIAVGKSYTLAVDREWPDARGVPMVEGFRKIFRGGPADRVSPDPKAWRIAPPKANTLDALTVSFPESLNYALLQRMLRVVSGRNDIAGSVRTGRQETEWQFTPRSPWKPGNYALVVDTAIEDLAGNSVAQPFDIDVFEHVTEHIAAKTIPLPFQINLYNRQ